MTWEQEAQEIRERRLAQWAEGMSRFSLPDWDTLPQLELYMDQVILLLKQYLAFLHQGGEEPAITASAVNNYVRLKVVPPPVKKKYGRVHLASLLIICMLKQSLSIASIQRMFPKNHSEEAVRALYNSFTAQCRRVTDDLVRLAGDDSAFLDTAHPAAAAAILTSLSKSLAEYLLLSEPLPARKSLPPSGKHPPAPGKNLPPEKNSS